MINLDHYSFDGELESKILPPDHALVRGQPINQPIYEQDYQWRLKIQPFTQGGFEARAVLVNRNHLNRLVNSNRGRGKRIKPKERDEADIQRDREKAAYRAARTASITIFMPPSMASFALICFVAAGKLPSVEKAMNGARMR